MTMVTRTTEGSGHLALRLASPRAFLRVLHVDPWRGRVLLMFVEERIWTGEQNRLLCAGLTQY